MDRRNFLKSMFAASALALVPTAAINAFVNKKTDLIDLGDGVIYDHTKRQIRITEPINMDEVHKKMAGYDSSKAYTKDEYKTFNGLDILIEAQVTVTGLRIDMPNPSMFQFGELVK
jgi:hypothetical protein